VSTACVRVRFVSRLVALACTVGGGLVQVERAFCLRVMLFALVAVCCLRSSLRVRFVCTAGWGLVQVERAFCLRDL